MNEINKKLTTKPGISNACNNSVGKAFHFFTTTIRGPEVRNPRHLQVFFLLIVYTLARYDQLWKNRGGTKAPTIDLSCSKNMKNENSEL